MLDFDTGDGLQKAITVWHCWQGRGIDSLIEMSREGRAHLWLFLLGLMPSVPLIDAMRGTLAAAKVDAAA